MHIDTDLAAFVLQTRTDLGLTQAECARRAGLDSAAWSRAERGGYKRITWEMGLRMLYGLGMIMDTTYSAPDPQPLPLFREARPGDQDGEG